MNSKQKGKRGELEWAAFLREKGFDARRGRQFKGTSDSPDVIDNSPFHWEVKRVEKLNIEHALLQAIADAGDKIPAVTFRKNRGEWVVVIRASDFFKLIG